MTDPVSASASAVTIIDRAIAAVGWVRCRLTRQSAPLGTGRYLHRGLEIRPVTYKVDLSGTLPRVEVELLAINYLRKPLHLRDVKIMRLIGQGHPTLDVIPLLHEVTLPPRCSQLVYCGRALADTEARHCRPIQGLAVVGGAINVAAHCQAGRQIIQFEAPGLRIDGSIREPSHAAV